jgi:hypothetical protein
MNFTFSVINHPMCPTYNMKQIFYFRQDLRTFITCTVPVTLTRQFSTTFQCFESIQYFTVYHSKLLTGFRWIQYAVIQYRSSSWTSWTSFLDNHKRKYFYNLKHKYSYKQTRLGGWKAFNHLEAQRNLLAPSYWHLRKKNDIATYIMAQHITNEAELTTAYINRI